MCELELLIDSQCPYNRRAQAWMKREYVMLNGEEWDHACGRPCWACFDVELREMKAAETDWYVASLKETATI